MNIPTIFKNRRKPKHNFKINGTVSFWEKPIGKNIIKGTKIAAILLGVIVIIAIIFEAITLWRFYVRPLEPYNEFTSSMRSSSQWDGSRQLFIGTWIWERDRNLVRNALVVVRPSDPSVHVVILPEETSLKDTNTFSQTISVPIDRYIVDKRAEAPIGDGYQISTTVLSFLETEYADSTAYLHLPTLFRTFESRVYTDLSPNEMIKLLRLMRETPEEDITVEDWPGTSLALEEFRTDVLNDSEILAGNRTVWIRNTTEIPGMASTISAYLYNLGFDVIRVDNANCASIEMFDCDSQKTTILTSKDYLHTYPVERIESLFKINAISGEGDDLRRADIIIFVGEDFQQFQSE
ncbi:LytR C-terminal domain-containing protein [candidate division WWE3 bacterium]|uniref:LytR C-terminal domain-containing protein n=1 Tax=candidate division WWE3 bacterium TaxID=2053526 RepID=A0A955LGN8_UNCKA|nr:LytR C-terminal domain-containing protein [candidate division WWE3 bacterium]